MASRQARQAGRNRRGGVEREGTDGAGRVSSTIGESERAWRRRRWRQRQWWLRTRNSSCRVTMPRGLSLPPSLPPSLSLYLSIYPSIYLSIHPSIYLSSFPRVRFLLSARRARGICAGIGAHARACLHALAHDVGTYVSRGLPAAVHPRKMNK